MTPTIGRVVIAQLGTARASNGANEAPAIITRVWSEGADHWTVNVTVFPDNAQPVPATSVYLFEDAASARAYIAENPHGVAAHWPERVAA